MNNTTDDNEDRNQDPNQLVWIAKYNTKTRIYHLNEDCQYLDKAHSRNAKPLSVLPADLRECKRCADVTNNHGEGGHLTRRKLLDANPEDLGLSPMGERSV